MVKLELVYVVEFLSPAEFEFSFSDLRAANVYHLLKRGITASLSPEDSTFPGEYDNRPSFHWHSVCIGNNLN